MRITKLKILIYVVFCLLLSGLVVQSYTAKAQEDDKKTTTLDFEDELIEGEVKKPELFYLMQKKQFNFKRLIKLRENFLPEMRRAGEEIPRGGRTN